jgi:hypothetical protein
VSSNSLNIIVFEAEGTLNLTRRGLVAGFLTRMHNTMEGYTSDTGKESGGQMLRSGLLSTSID